MKQFLIITCSIILLFLLPLSSQASHVWGGEITYLNLGNDNYSIQLRMYRDCSGIAFANSLDVSLTSPSCGNQTLTLNQLVGYPQDVTPTCPSAISRCNSNFSTPEGIQEIVYKSTIQLTGCWANADDILIYYQAANRSSKAYNLANNSNTPFHIDTRLNTIVDNSSPIFVNPINTYYCVNQPAQFNVGAYDIDGDSLVYSLTECKQDTNTAVYYHPGYSGTNPVFTTSGITFNAATGQMEFTPNTFTRGAICVTVEEYRNGIKIGEVTKELLFSLLNCTDDVPVLSGINGTASGTGTTGGFHQTVCYGDTVLFTVASYDKNVIDDTVNTGSQAISMQMNLAGSAMGANFTTSNTGNYPTGTFMWIPNINDIGFHYFDILIQDDACPIYNMNTYTFLIQVNGESVPYSTPNFNTFCLDTGTYAIPNFTPITGGLWTGTGIVDGQNGLFSPSVAGVGVHNLNFNYIDNDNCPFNRNTTILVANNYTVNAGVTDTVCANAIPFTLSNFSPTNGTWTGNGVSSSGIFSPSAAGVGTHTLTYTQSNNNCIGTDTKDVVVVPVPIINTGGTINLCNNLVSALTATPPGGFWSGNGIIDINAGIFDANLITGNSTFVQYHYSNDYCQNSEFLSIQLIAPPTVNAGSVDTLHANDAPILFAGTPAGGVWSGDGINTQTGFFDPSTVGQGTYILTYTYTDSLCSVISDTKTVEVLFGVPTTEINANTGIQIFPNPFDDVINIHFKNGLQQTEQLKILNTLGAVVYSTSIAPTSDFRLDIDNKLSTGVYFIQISKNGQTHTFRMMKQ